MDDFNTLTQTERLLLMAAAVHGLGPHTDLNYANTARVVNQALRWRGLSAEEIRGGWRDRDCDPAHAEVYDALIRMTHQMQTVGPGRAPERPGPVLFEGSGNWGVPGDPDCPACWPQYNSCHLTAEGERIALELLERHPEFRLYSAGRGVRMEQILAYLLSRLLVIGEAHGELYDTEVRERLDDAIHHGFLIPTHNYQLPEEFALYSEEANGAVKEALGDFLEAARDAASADGLSTFHQRLTAFQNLGVEVGPQRVCYNDFFGYADPKRYDEAGNVIRR